MFSTTAVAQVALSKDKQAFLKQESMPDISALEAKKLPAIAAHYAKKHKIKIVINGESEYGQKTIKENQQKKQVSADIEIKLGYSLHLRGFAENIQNTCLTSKQCEEEILELQKNLKDNEKIGYVLTNNNRVASGHFEVLIITKDKIIKPVQWTSDRAIVDIEHQYEFNLYQLITRIPNDERKIFDDDRLPCTPQADNGLCAALGMLYLKELLKNDAEQLEKFTLQFSFYLHEDKLCHFFFPSPHVLRYSQVSAYNKIVYAMLMDDSDAATVKVTHNNRVFEVATLKSILKNSMVHAKEAENLDVVKANQEILHALPVFREAWVAEYTKAKQKRKLMYRPLDPMNWYLLKRFMDIARIGNSAESKVEASAESKVEFKA